MKYFFKRTMGPGEESNFPCVSIKRHLKASTSRYNSYFFRCQHCLGVKDPPWLSQLIESTWGGGGPRPPNQIPSKKVKHLAFNRQRGSFEAGWFSQRLTLEVQLDTPPPAEFGCEGAVQGSQGCNELSSW